MTYFSVLLLSLLLTIVLMPILVRMALRFGIVDMPDARKVHSAPVPRIGGLAIALGSCIPFALWHQTSEFTIAWLVGAGILVLLGLIDDIRGLDYKIKFLGQIAAAMIMVFYGGLRIESLGGLLPESIILPQWFSIALTLVAIIGVTNAINLSDGLDGLAGGICFLCLCCIAYLAFTIENMVILFAAISLAGAVFGFLRFNTYPATLFMGDTGSLFLGFSVITFSLSITQGSTPLSPVLPLLILGFPVLDTLTVMSERIADGRSPFAPDKNHFHHRMLRLGFFHTESVFMIYVFQAVLVITAIVFRYHSEWFLLSSYLAFSGMVLLVFFTAEKYGWKIRRFDLVDRIIKGHLQIIVKQGLLIKLSFRVVEYGLPVLLLFSCFIPSAIPDYFHILSAVLFLLLLIIWLVTMSRLRSGALALYLSIPLSWLRRAVLTLCLYLFIPVLIYVGVTHKAPWFSEELENIYNVVYLVLMAFVILTLKFSRRKKGFKVTTMDFLILFLVFIVPLIGGTYLQYKSMGLIVAMTVMLFFSYEVLIGELRGNLNRLSYLTLASLLLVAGRGFLGF